MTRKIVFSLLATFLLNTVSFTSAQPTKKVARIAYLGAGSALNPGPDPGPDALIRLGSLRRGLRELGYEEGKSIIIDYRTTAGRPDRIPGIVAELARLKTAVIVWSAGQEEARQVKTMPIVYVATSDFVATGLVESLARPGGNITGITSLAPELGGKRLELLKETIPKLAQVAFLFNPAVASNAVELEQVRGAAAGLGVTLRTVEARSPDEIDKAFATMIRQRVQGFSTASGSVNNTSRLRITEMAAKNRLPAVYHQSQFVEAGGLMSYGANLGDMYYRAATHVDKILKGTKPADIPVEQPMKFEFIVNLKAAKQIGLTVPPNVLVRADRVIR